MRAIHKKWLAGMLVFIMALSVVAPAFAADPLEVEVPVSVLETGSVAPGQTYDIVLIAEDAAYPMPEGSVDGEYTMSVDKGDYTLAINYDEVGFYYYTLKQLAGDDPLAHYDDRVYHVTVFVSFAEDGSLESAVVLKVDGETAKPDEAEFINDWKPEGKWAPVVKKELIGRELKEGEFTFNLLDSEGNVLQTTKNDADGNVVFEEMIFNEEKLEGIEYTVEEVIGDAYAVTYAKPLTFKLYIKDNGDGSLSFTSDFEDKLVFENIFEIPKTDITMTKKWVGGPAVKPAIHVQLLRDGKPFGDKVQLRDTTTYTWKDLDKTDETGKPYVYTVEEVTVPNAYKATYSEDTLTITNTWTKEELPSTGVGSNIPLLATGIGLLGVTALLGIKRRRDESK